MNTYKRINIAAGGGGDSSLNFSITFNETTSWGSPNLGVYTITVLAATHNKGQVPQVVVYETVSPGVHQEVTVNSIIIDNTGNISITVLESPDLRFAGKITIG